MYRLMFSGLSNPTSRPSCMTGKLPHPSPNNSSCTRDTFANGGTTGTLVAITSETGTCIPTRLTLSRRFWRETIPT